MESCVNPGLNTSQFSSRIQDKGKDEVSAQEFKKEKAVVSEELPLLTAIKPVISKLLIPMTSFNYLHISSQVSKGNQHRASWTISL